MNSEELMDEIEEFESWVDDFTKKMDDILKGNDVEDEVKQVEIKNRTEILETVKRLDNGNVNLKDAKKDETVIKSDGATKVKVTSQTAKKGVIDYSMFDKILDGESDSESVTETNPSESSKTTNSSTSAMVATNKKDASAGNSKSKPKSIPAQTQEDYYSFIHYASTKHNKDGNQAFKSGNYESAIQCYTSAIESFDLPSPPSSPSVGIPSSSKFTFAFPTIKPSRPKPTPNLFTNRALAFLKLSKYDEAIQDCEKAIELDRYWLRSYWRLIEAWRGKKVYDEAIKWGEILKIVLKEVESETESKVGGAGKTTVTTVEEVDNMLKMIREEKFREEEKQKVQMELKNNGQFEVLEKFVDTIIDSISSAPSPNPKQKSNFLESFRILLSSDPAFFALLRHLNFYEKLSTATTMSNIDSIAALFTVIVKHDNESKLEIIPWVKLALQRLEPNTTGTAESDFNDFIELIEQLTPYEEFWNHLVFETTPSMKLALGRLLTRQMQFSGSTNWLKICHCLVQSGAKSSTPQPTTDKPLNKNRIPELVVLLNLFQIPAVDIMNGIRKFLKQWTGMVATKSGKTYLTNLDVQELTMVSDIIDAVVMGIPYSHCKSTKSNTHQESFNDIIVEVVKMHLEVLCRLTDYFHDKSTPVSSNVRELLPKWLQSCYNLITFTVSNVDSTRLQTHPPNLETLIQSFEKLFQVALDALNLLKSEWKVGGVVSDYTILVFSRLLRTPWFDFKKLGSSKRLMTGTILCGFLELLYRLMENLQHDERKVDSIKVDLNVLNAGLLAFINLIESSMNGNWTGDDQDGKSLIQVWKRGGFEQFEEMMSILRREVVEIVERKKCESGREESSHFDLEIKLKLLGNLGLCIAECGRDVSNAQILGTKQLMTDIIFIMRTLKDQQGPLTTLISNSTPTMKFGHSHSHGHGVGEPDQESKTRSRKVVQQSIKNLAIASARLCQSESGLKTFRELNGIELLYGMGPDVLMK